MARKDDYIPSNDEKFAEWLGRVSAALNAHLDDLGLKAEDVAFLADARAEMQEIVDLQKELERRMRGLMGRKRDVRPPIEQAVRRLVMQVKHHPAMTDELRLSMGLTIPKGYRSRRGVGKERPLLFLEAQGGTVFVHFGTMPRNEHLNGKPKWARGCCIYRRKAGESEYRLIAESSRSPYRDEIEDEAVSVTYLAAYQASGTHEIGRYSTPSTVAAGTGEPGARPRKLRRAA